MAQPNTVKPLEVSEVDPRLLELAKKAVNDVKAQDMFLDALKLLGESPTRSDLTNFTLADQLLKIAKVLRGEPAESKPTEELEEHCQDYVRHLNDRDFTTLQRRLGCRLDDNRNTVGSLYRCAFQELAHRELKN